MSKEIKFDGMGRNQLIDLITLQSKVITKTAEFINLYLDKPQDVSTMKTSQELRELMNEYITKYPST